MRGVAGRGGARGSWSVALHTLLHPHGEGLAADFPRVDVRADSGRSCPASRKAPRAWEPVSTVLTGRQPGLVSRPGARAGPGPHQEACERRHSNKSPGPPPRGPPALTALGQVAARWTGDTSSAQCPGPRARPHAEGSHASGCTGSAVTSSGLPACLPAQHPAARTPARLRGGGLLR